MAQKNLITVCCLIATLFSITIAQESSQQSADRMLVEVVAVAFQDHIRITAAPGVVQLHLEVFAIAGEKILDQTVQGNVIDWHLQKEKQLAAGRYVCVVTATSIDGRLAKKLGFVAVAANSLSAERADVSSLAIPPGVAIGNLDQESSWTVLDEDKNQTTTVIAHDGSDGQIVRGRGAFSFRLGNFFSGSDREQMRLTEEGFLGIGTAKPEARLDVAGTVRAREGFSFLNGSTLNVNGKGVLSLTSANGTVVPNIAGTGTQNKLSKWIDNSGTLGDSVVAEANGNIGVGNANPGSLVHIGPFAGYGATTGLLLGNNLLGSQFDRALQVAPVQTANPGTNSILIYTLPTVNAGVTVPKQYGFFVDGRQGAGAVTAYSALTTGQFPSLGATNNTHLLMGQLNIPSGNFGIFDATGFKSFFSGNMGLGTTAPTRHLHLVGTGDQEIAIESSDTGGRQWTLQSSRGTNNGRFEIIDRTAPASRLTILSDGSVGIGTTVPGAKLDVNGAINSATQYNILGERVFSAHNTSTFVGWLGGNTGGANSFFGALAGRENTSGSDNSFFGHQAGINNTTGPGNSFFGASAGSGNTAGLSNTFLGRLAGNVNTTGDLNTVIGALADVGSNNLTNAIAIGARARVDQSNSLVLGSVQGFNSATSDTRVGIGTTAPGNPLEVVGAGTANGGVPGVAEVVAHFKQTTTGKHGAISVDAPTDQSAMLYLAEQGETRWDIRNDAGDNDKLKFRSHDSPSGAGTTVVTFGKSGSVGIGDTTPSTKLSVVDFAPAISGEPAINSKVVFFENTADDCCVDVLVLKIGVPGNPATTNNFISFWKGNGDSVGAIQGNGFGSVELAGAGSDYAEWLPRLNKSEKLLPGDIVGLHSGRITKETNGATQIMAVSTGPLVAGNDPGENSRGEYERVAFIGQVMTRVRGAVRAGDFIVASGLNDGVGIAVSPERITAKEFEQVVGQAWESSDDPAVKSLRVAVGLNRRDPTVSRLIEFNRIQSARLTALESRLTAFEASLRSNSWARNLKDHREKGTKRRAAWRRDQKPVGRSSGN